MATVLAPGPPAALTAAGRPAARLKARLADPRRALLAAVVVLVAAAGLDALSDPDVWWHLRLGDLILAQHQIPAGEVFAYTATGSPLVDHEWLAEALFAAIAAIGGLFLVTVSMGAVAWSAMLATLLRGSRRGTGPVVMAVGLVLGARAVEPVLGTRPQVFTFALICWTLWIAESYLRDGGRRHWLLPPIFLVWANLHAGFIGGLGFLAIVVVAEAAKRRLPIGVAAPRSRILGLGIATGLSVFAACVNPYGPGLLAYSLTTGSLERSLQIIEWQSPDFANPAMWALLVLLLTFAGLLVTCATLGSLRSRIDLRDVALSVAGAGLALYAVRNTALCVAAMTPAWMSMAAGVTQHVGARRASRPRAAAKPRAAPLIGVALVAVAVVSVVAVGAREHQDATPAGTAGAYPACAAGVLARAPSTQRIFTAYGAGGYLIYRLWPHGSVYEYGESVSLGAAVFDDYQRIASGARKAPTALQLIAASGTTAVLYSRGALTGELDHAPGWTRIADDHGTLLYVRGDASWAAGASCPGAVSSPG